MCLVAFQCCKRCHRNFKFALTNCDPVMLAGHNRSRTTNMFIYTSPSFALYPECRFLEVYWRALVRGLCLSCFEAKNPDKPDAWDPWYGSTYFHEPLCFYDD